jgi:GPH family glycoside/pentoside/hexuronide:cation symporter
MSQAISQKERLPLRTKILYGAGDFGFAMTDSMIGVLFAIYLADVVGLNPALAALSVFVGRTADYVNDPIMGYISDRTRSRWGRRRPFILFGFIPYALSFALMWWIPPISSQVGLAIYYGAAYFLYDTCATFIYMPYYALTPELTQDYDERTSLTSIRMVFSIIGTMLAFTLPLAIIGTMRPNNASRIFSVGAAMGVLAALPLILTFFGVRERPEFLGKSQPSLKESLQAAGRNRPFLYTMGIFLFTWAALEVVQAMLLFFLKYRMGLEEESDMIFASLFVASLISLPFWNRLSGRTDKRLAYIAGMLFMSVVLVALIFALPEWGLPVVLVLAVLAGVGFGAVQVLPWAILPDSIEWDELQTGQRHEGMFYSLVTLFRKIAASLSIPVLLLMLSWTGYIPNAATQPPSAILGIRLLTGPYPAALLLVGVLFASRYPLNRERFARVRQELAERRQGRPDSPGSPK